LELSSTPLAPAPTVQFFNMLLMVPRLRRLVAARGLHRQMTGGQQGGQDSQLLRALV
jgi:hypothetical protein